MTGSWLVRALVLAVIGGVLVTACAGPGGAPRPSDGAEEPSGAATPSPADRLRVSTAGWSTDFSRHTVPLSEFTSGGPGKDGIPAIDAPRFESAASVGWLVDREPVIVFGIGDDWRAYPIQVLVWHEIVNDEVAGIPVAVTFCPLCHTAIVIDRRLGDRVLDFGTTGNLRHSDLVMYDRQTETWWQQATGRGVVGELAGAQLELLPSRILSWEQFRADHPDGQVLSRDTGHVRDYGRNPYPGYDRADASPFLLDATLVDGRLSPKVRVLGLQLGSEAVAYPFPLLREHPVVNDEVGGTPVLVVWTDGAASGLGGSTVAGGDIVGSATAFERELDGRALTFGADGGGGLVDDATGSHWSRDGVALSGPLAGQRLLPIVADTPFWFAWAVFLPDTRIWMPDDR